MRALVTGAAGFCGHHVVAHLLEKTDWEIVVLDCLNYASFGWRRLRDAGVYRDPRLHCLATDFSKQLTPGVIQEIGDVDYILHIGAQTHVDRSVANALPFVLSNVLGTMWMLEFSRTLPDLRRFIYFSTDEVFGPADHGRKFTDWDRYNSTNPYAASKAGGEELALAYSNTYDIPMVITHCCNIFGERQHWEKYIPMAIRLILAGESVLVNADSVLTHIGSRYYLYGRHVADAMLWMLNADLPWCDKFNITSQREVGNLEMAEMIAMILDKNLVYKLVDPDIGRHSHDLRYDMDGTRLAVSGWSPPDDFEDKLAQTVKWYADNPDWLS